MEKRYLVQLVLTVLSAIALVVSAFNNELLIFTNMILTTTLLAISYNYIVVKNTRKAYLFLSFGIATAILIILELFKVI